MATDQIDQLFDLLDERRHLPDYRLEPRVSPFFELFLPEVLEKHLGAVRLPIIPEFPLKKSDSNQSNKVDFFALSGVGEDVYLIELKTDVDSLREAQDNYLKCASQKTLHHLIEDVKCVACASRSYGKYAQLLRRLSRLELIGDVSHAWDKAFASKHAGWSSAVRRIINKAPKRKPELVYIVPDCSKARQGKHSIPEDAHCICFEEVAHVVGEHVPIGKRFAESLWRWAAVDAGQAPPNPTAP